MEDLVYNSGYSRVEEAILLEEALEIKEGNRTAIFNVVTLFDAGNGQEVSVASFNELDIARNYVKESFKRISKRWLEEEGCYNLEYIKELKESGDLIFEPMYAALILGDYSFSITITVNEVFTKETYKSENSKLINFAGIVKIDEETFNKIIEAYNCGSKEYHGKKYILEKDSLFIGIDNSSGDCWVEESSDLNKLVSWLRSEIDTEELYKDSSTEIDLFNLCN